MDLFPEESVLIARGKYSTLSSEKRAHLKELRDYLERMSGCASRVIRAPDDMTFMSEQAAQLATLTERVLFRVADIQGLQAHLDELRPIAWGGKAEHE
jgi:hypothetical protein